MVGCVVSDDRHHRMSPEQENMEAAGIEPAYSNPPNVPLSRCFCQEREDEDPNGEMGYDCPCLRRARETESESAAPAKSDRETTSHRGGV